jgi:hypothetical protein
VGAEIKYLITFPSFSEASGFFGGELVPPYVGMMTAWPY